MPRANSVCGIRRSNASAIDANSVRVPVATASTFAVPLRTDVPVKTALVRCAMPASGADRPADFTTGKVSPVRTDSLTLKSRDSRITPSTGMRLPADRQTTSPGTMSSTPTVRSKPSLRTVAVREMRCCSTSIAREAPYSCVKLRMQLASTIEPIIAASCPSPTNIETAAAKTRIRTSGLRNWRAKTADADAPDRGASAFRPNLASRIAASELARPEVEVSSCPTN